MASFAKRYAGQSVNVLDDVVFSGESMLKIINDLLCHGINVNTIVTCVIQDKAYEALSKLPGINIQYLYKFEAVEDIVCTRDFIFGVPDGGLNYFCDADEIKCCSYIEPFGNARIWASLPDQKVKSFSLQMLQLSYEFWSMIEKSTGRVATLSDLQKQPAFWPTNTDNIVPGLAAIIDSLGSSEIMNNYKKQYCS